MLVAEIWLETTDDIREHYTLLIGRLPPGPVSDYRLELVGVKSCIYLAYPQGASQRMGLGRQMTDMLIARAKACGMRRMFVQVLASNVAMMNLARQCGFVDLPDTAECTVRSLCLVLENVPATADLFNMATACPRAVEQT